MRYQPAAVVALAAMLSPAIAQTPQAVPSWTLKARINGVELVGEWELDDIPGEATADAATAAAVVRVDKDSTFQLGVDLLDPNGARQDVSGSTKLMYRSLGCLTITSAGVATVAAPPSSRWSCDAGGLIPLTIIYKDEASGVAAINMYLFKIERP